MGYNLFSVFLTDLINLFAAPGLTSIVFFFFDLINFCLMPIAGAFVNISATYNYENDPITFTNAGLSKQDMYVSMMATVKDFLYSALGKPDFYVTQPEY